MSPNGSNIDATHQKIWRSIRPWSPPLSLIVREITSVSVTFVLSSTLSGAQEDALHDHESSSDDDDPTKNARNGDANISMNGNGHSNAQNLTARRRSSVIPLDAHALTVNINGQPWSRFIYSLSEKTDEAIIIIYGFMPGKQYDVVLGIVRGGQTNSVHGQLVTDDSSTSDRESSTPAVEPISNATTVSSLQLSTSTPAVAPPPPPVDPAVSNPSSSPPPAAPEPLTFEECYAQLQQKLATINEERDALLAKLKAARKEAQKADAALRSEIEALKRGSEKHAASENRAKQKLLSLQEMVKRTQTLTRETEQQVKETEDSLPELNKQQAGKENEYQRLKEEAESVRKNRELQTESGKRKMEGMRSELAIIKSKLERLQGKKEKLETSVVPDLEQQLKKVEIDISKAELESRDLQERQVVQQSESPQAIQEMMPLPPHSGLSHDSQTLNGIGRSATTGLHQQSDPVLTPSQRPRLPNLNLGPIGRPTPPAPIQRPTLGEIANITVPSGPVHHNLWPSAGARQLHQLPHRSSLPPPVPIVPTSQSVAAPRGRSGSLLGHTNDITPPTMVPTSLSSHPQLSQYHQYQGYAGPILSSQLASILPSVPLSSKRGSSSSSSSQSSPRDNNLGPIAPPSGPGPSRLTMNPTTTNTAFGGILLAPSGNSTLPFTPATSTGSTLSSRAPPFEPGKPLMSASNSSSMASSGMPMNVPPHFAAPPGLTLQKLPVSSNPSGNTNLGPPPYHYQPQRSPKTSLTSSGGTNSKTNTSASGQMKPQITIMQRPPGASRNLLAVGGAKSHAQQP